MKKSIVVLLMTISFLAGIVVARMYEYRASGKRRIELLKEQETLEKQYKILNERFEMVEKEIQRKEINDSI